MSKLRLNGYELLDEFQIDSGHGNDACYVNIYIYMSQMKLKREIGSRNTSLFGKIFSNMRFCPRNEIRKYLHDHDNVYVLARPLGL